MRSGAEKVGGGNLQHGIQLDLIGFHGRCAFVHRSLPCCLHLPLRLLTAPALFSKELSVPGRPDSGKGLACYNPNIPLPKLTAVSKLQNLLLLPAA